MADLERILNLMLCHRLLKQQPHSLSVFIDDRKNWKKYARPIQIEY